jgi:hypothetical protein
MRCNLIQGSAFSMAVVLCVGLVSPASAQATATTSPNAAIIKSLRQAHHLLVRADHDYDGHRAKAAEEVAKALRDLGYHHKKTVTTTPAAAVVTNPTVHAGQPKLHESQGSSDAQVQQALQILQGTVSQLSGKHPKALANINAAIGQINTALKLK